MRKMFWKGLLFFTMSEEFLLKVKKISRTVFEKGMIFKCKNIFTKFRIHARLPIAIVLPHV